MKLLRTFLIFFGSAVLCSLGDANHVATHTDGYPAWHFFIPGLKIPFWVPIQFGFAGVAIVNFHRLIRKKLHPVQKRSYSNRKAVLSGLSFFLLYLGSGSLPLSTPGMMDFFLAFCALTLWWVFDGTRFGLFTASLIALAGTMVEITLVKVGVFFYFPKVAILFGVPSWLPWLYLSASIAGKEVASTEIFKPESNLTP